jgi:4-oxalomesaconate tautomerase
VGVLGAVTVATACALPGSVANRVAALPEGLVKMVSVEHPSGEFTVELQMDPAAPDSVLRAALLRTARLIMRGEVLIPESALAGSKWRPGQSAREEAA